MQIVEYNIHAGDNGQIMLGCWVPCLTLALLYLDYYRAYVGKPYPNGKGHYPDRYYSLISRVVDVKVQ